MPSEQARVAARRHMGAEVRRLREAAGLSGQGLAHAVGWSQSKVSRVEQARTRTEVHDVAVLLDVLGVPDDDRKRLLALAEDAAGPAESWRNSSRSGLTRRQQDFIAFEASAHSIRHYNPVLLPGYLQTRDYAERVITMAGAKDVSRAVDYRLSRRAILAGEPAPNYEVVLMEAAVRWRPGPVALWAAQVKDLLAMSQRSNLCLRVIPLDQEQSVFVQHPFVLYRFSDGVAPEALVETTTTDVRVTEPNEVATLDAEFSRLARSALTEEASRAFMRKLAASASDAGPH